MDVTEIGKVIDTADVLVIRFQILDERLLIDNRTNDVDGPLIAVVPKAGSVEERFKSLKRLRPRFPLPDKITSFMSRVAAHGRDDRQTPPNSNLRVDKHPGQSKKPFKGGDYVDYEEVK